MTYTLVRTGLTLQTEAGTFDDVIQVQRDPDDTVGNGQNEETRQFWFAPGVGKVKETNVSTGNFEELIDYDIP